MKNKIIFTMIIVLLFISNVYASSVKINGGSLDIYDSGGYGYATFDKGSNTLTLNGYNNDYILFQGFNGKTVNVILKGNNTIYSSGYVEDSNISALGFDYDSSSENVILNIKGEDNSKLNISGYYNGFYIYNGKIYISNVNINFEDVNYVGVYNYSGELVSIKDSSINASGVGYIVANDVGDVILDNVKYKSNNTALNDLYTPVSLTINNSEIESIDSNNFVSAEKVNINNSKVNFNNGESLFNVNDAIIKDSVVVGNVNDIANYIYSTLTIDNSDVNFISKNGVALYLNSEEKTDFNDKIILKDVYVLQKDIVPAVTELDSFFSGIIYSYFKEKPKDKYVEEEILDLIDIAAKEIHFVPNNYIENPQTGDNIITYIVFGSLFLIGLVYFVMYILKRRKIKH